VVLSVGDNVYRICLKPWSDVCSRRSTGTREYCSLDYTYNDMQYSCVKMFSIVLYHSLV